MDRALRVAAKQQRVGGNVARQVLVEKSAPYVAIDLTYRLDGSDGGPLLPNGLGPPYLLSKAWLGCFFRDIGL